MAQYTGTMEQTVDVIRKGLQAQLEQRIYNKLFDEAKAVIKEVAAIEAQKCIENITAWRMVDRNTIELNIYFGENKQNG